MAAVQRVVAVARVTFLEVVRNRILYVLLAFAGALMAFSLVLGELSLHEEVRVVKDLGLAAMSAFGILIALFLGVNLLSKELDKKTVYFVVPKPMHRHEFLLGKYLGLAATLTVLVIGMSLALAAFVAAGGGRHGVALLRAEVLLWLELLLLVAVALLFSSFSSPYLSASFAGALWLIGRNAPELEALASGKLADTPVGAILHGIVRVLPDFHAFYVSGGSLDGQVVSIHEGFVGWGYVATAAGYAGAYGVACLALASVLFARRDFP
jgi:ABC-type transport system involved in multi-copper enzyme maturation permease subunit